MQKLSEGAHSITRMEGLTNMVAVLLVGGFGTRLRTVIDSKPKALASVGEQPFLSLLLFQLRSQGIRHIVLCTGYLGGQIEEMYGDGANLGLQIIYSREESPLGTGGALKLAAPQLHGMQDFLVMNGDSFVEIDFPQLVQAHRQHNGIMTLAVTQVEDGRRYGSIQTDGSGRVTAFLEKSASASHAMINAGVYLMNAGVLDIIPQGQSSLEKDVFPRLLAHGVYAEAQSGLFIDIGTPGDYMRAQALLQRFV